MTTENMQNNIEDMFFPNTGFPFDDSDHNLHDRPHHSFDSHFADLVQRHPELAEHLDPEVFRRRSSSNSSFGSGGRTSRRPPHFQNLFDDFDSRFEQPQTSSSSTQSPHSYQQKPPTPHQYQQQHQSPPPAAENYKQPQKQQVETPKEPQSTADVPSEPKNVIQQSQTVDLGQKQEQEVDERGQRSMSAPPNQQRGATGKRYKSGGITIPIQRSSEMGSAQSTQTPPGGGGGQHAQEDHVPLKPNERIIPIHIEGRDTPYVPKNVNITPGATAQPHQEYFGRDANDFTRYVPKENVPSANSFAEQQARRKEMDQQKYQEYLRQQQQQQQRNQQQQQHQQHHEQQNQQQEQEQPEVKAPEPAKVALTPLEHIQNIQKAVSELMEQVEKFEGKQKDKNYLYLDEMLTRNLIKLDNIDTEGKDTLRQARKEAVNCIQQCIKILENKAVANEQKLMKGKQNEETVLAAAQSSDAAILNENQANEIREEGEKTTQEKAVEGGPVEMKEEVAKPESAPNEPSVENCKLEGDNASHQEKRGDTSQETAMETDKGEVDGSMDSKKAGKKK